MPRKSFNLAHSFYSTEHVHRAIEDFWEDFSLSYQNDILDITAESEEAIDEIFHELINYITSLYNETV